MHTRFTLVDGVLLEKLGDDCVALLPDTTVVRLSGPAAEVSRRVAAGGDMAGLDGSVVQELIRAGVVRPEAGVTRRHLVQLGAVATGAGVATLALPSVAAANSVEFLTGSTASSLLENMGLPRGRGGSRSLWETTSSSPAGHRQNCEF